MAEIDRSTPGAAIPSGAFPLADGSRASAVASPTPPTTIALLRALTALGPRLHELTTARDAQALYALVCQTLRECGLFAHITHVESAPEPRGGVAARSSGQHTLRIVATSIDEQMCAGIEALIGTSFIGYPIAAAGPYQTVLELGEPVVVERLVEIFAPIVPHLSAEQRAQLAAWVHADRAILAAIVSGGAVRSVLSVWGPSDLLGAEDAPAVAALAAQIGAALENARLLAEMERERERWRATVEDAPEFVCTCDADRRVTYINAAYRRAVGAPLEPLAPSDDHAAYFGLFLPGGSGLIPADQLPFARVIATGEPVHGFEMLHRGTSGQERLILWDAAPMRDAAGKVMGVVATGRDVTEQRRIQREVAERAGQLEAIFESITDGVTVYGAHGETTYLNQAYRAMLALTPDELRRPIDARGRAILPRYPSSGEPMPREAWPSKRLLGGEVLTGASSVDVLVQAHDGRELLINCAGAPVLGKQGEIVGAVMVIRDVAERRRLEQRTQEALDALLAMAEALVRTPVRSAQDETGSVDVVSLGQQAQSSPKDAERDATQRLAELTLRVLSCRHVSIVALHNPHAPTSAAPTMPTVPEAPEAPEAPTSAFGQRVYGIAVAGFPPEHVRDWWRRFDAGVPVELLATQTQLARLAAGETFFAQPRSREYRGEEFGISTELWVPLRTGSHLIGAMAIDYGDGADAHQTLEQRLTPQDRALAEAVGKLVALVIERERLLRERAEARASELALRQANARLDTFISLASHELRTPLTTIMANAQIAQRQAKRIAAEARSRGYDNAEDVEKLAYLLARTHLAAVRQNRLVGDLLDVSRIHAGKLELRPEPLDLAPLVADAVEEQRLAHPEREITLRLPLRPVMVTADGERIRQVVANYLTNAVKYAPAGPPIEVSLGAEASLARVRVRDYGPGIAPKEQPRIWERFYRAPDAEHRSGSGIGLGLGLYICRQIVERHHGHVSVENTPGKGATFSFTLPLAG